MCVCVCVYVCVCVCVCVCVYICVYVHVCMCAFLWLEYMSECMGVCAHNSGCFRMSAMFLNGYYFILKLIDFRCVNCTINNGENKCKSMTLEVRVRAIKLMKNAVYQHGLIIIVSMVI